MGGSRNHPIVFNFDTNMRAKRFSFMKFEVLSSFSCHKQCFNNGTTVWDMEGVCSEPKFFPKRVIYWYSLHVFLARRKVWWLRSFLHAPRVSLLKLTKETCSDVFHVMNESSTSLFNAHVYLLTPCGEAAEFSQLSSLPQGLIKRRLCKHIRYIF